jgi:hypothetical protein
LSTPAESVGGAADNPPSNLGIAGYGILVPSKDTTQPVIDSDTQSVLVDNDVESHQDMQPSSPVGDHQDTTESASDSSNSGNDLHGSVVDNRHNRQSRRTRQSPSYLRDYVTK